MNVLFIGYWDIEEPLTKATIFPHLKILQEMKTVSTIVFVNTERTSSNPQFLPDYAVSKIVYRPVLARNFKLALFGKASDFVYFPAEISRLLREFDVHVIFARGALAGSLAYLCWRKTRVPFVVESFEPHADYMLESGVWHKFDLRYRFQKRWEAKQIRHAKGLLPVADGYREYLITRGLLPEKVATVPCSVDFRVFRPDVLKREAMRKKYRISMDALVGVYAGKFGGLYLEEESFVLFRLAFQYFKDFFLVILSPSELHAWISLQIQKHRLPTEQILLKFADFREVPDYLVMGNFGFANYKPGFYKKFLSPVKVGEYWACGLPVVMTKGVGDESRILEELSAGVLFDPDQINGGIYEKLATILAEPGLEIRISEIARKMRSPEKVKEAYHYFLADCP